MDFFDQLTHATREEQEALFRVPFVRAAVAGELDLPTYVRFLSQAYHHVRHTVPLLMTAGGAMPFEYEWLRRGIATYISEEIGHEEWILSDIQECGGDPEAVKNATPSTPVELMVAYAYDVIHRHHPVGFFGMVHVLEGASVRGATRAAEALQQNLGLPESAFTYLSTHGDLDQDHVGFLKSLVNQVERPEHRELILHCSRTFSKLYADVFRWIGAPEAACAEVAS